MRDLRLALGVSADDILVIAGAGDYGVPLRPLHYSSSLTFQLLPLLKYEQPAAVATAGRDEVWHALLLSGRYESVQWLIDIVIPAETLSANRGTLTEWVQAALAGLDPRMIEQEDVTIQYALVLETLARNGGIFE